MKRNIAVSLLGVFGLISSVTTQAGISLQMVEPDQCQYLAGSWTGTGHAKAMGDTVQCDYEGKGEITGYTDLNIELQLQRSSGSWVCPTSHVMTLKGHCDSKTGKVSVTAEGTKISGVMDNSNEKVYLSGTVTFGGVVQAEIVAALNKEKQI